MQEITMIIRNIFSVVLSEIFSFVKDRYFYVNGTIASKLFYSFDMYYSFSSMLVKTSFVQSYC